MYDVSDAPEGFIFYHGRVSPRSMDVRTFVAWDGEGITFPGETQQEYVLFGNSLGFQVSDTQLSTKQCLQMMMDTEEYDPLAIHFGFGFSYDVEMILKDVPTAEMRLLYRNGFCFWEGFRIEYRRNKWFQVSKGKTVCRIWDVWSFFSTSLVVALQEYLGDSEQVNRILSGKQHRGLFTYDEMQSLIIPYWKDELSAMVALMNELRSRLYNAGYRISAWHGPGAVSTYAMKQRGVKAMMSDIPADVNTAARYAYAGGRFEMFRIGYHHNECYQYDIRSAYPAAIRDLPDLSKGSWEHVISPDRVERFGVYRIEFTYPQLMTLRPMPFYYRDEQSRMHYPNTVHGWYWSPEAKIVALLGDQAKITEGWVFHDNGERPFAWIQEVYDQRAQWKREGNPSQIALKLLMNSMYGKFAQRVGWSEKGAPTWHQLEWAGFITSQCRSRLFYAMLEAQSKSALIAVETDGIFTSQPLRSVTIGENLGEWEQETYQSLIYLQSGFYWKQSGDKWIPRCRGFDKNSITVETGIAALGKWRPWDSESPKGSLMGTSTRFATMGNWLRSPNGETLRRSWETAPHTLTLGNDGKRIHRPAFCEPCAYEMSPADVMHDLTITNAVGGTSYEHILPWITNKTNPFRTTEEGIRER